MLKSLIFTVMTIIYKQYKVLHMNWNDNNNPWGSGGNGNNPWGKGPSNQDFES